MNIEKASRDRIGRRALRRGVISVTAIAFALVGGPALADDGGESEPIAWQYVANKPDGAGAVTPGDLKVAGNSGKLLLPGAFISGDVVGLDDDIFIRGLPDGGPFVGTGDVPANAGRNGSPTNGVQSYVFD